MNNRDTLYNSMHSSTKKLGVLSKNLDNVLTPGYKSINPQSVMFSEVLQDMFKDNESGPLLTTNNKLDMAISKPNAYFLVEGQDGPERSRNGHFSLNAEGKIVNDKNQELVILDTDGEALNLHRSEDFTITHQGEITANGKILGRIALDYENKQPGEEAFILQGRIEGSTTDLTNNIMNIMRIKRHVDTLNNVLAMELSTDKSLMEAYGRNV